MRIFSKNEANELPHNSEDERDCIYLNGGIKHMINMGIKIRPPSIPERETTMPRINIKMAPTI